MSRILNITNGDSAVEIMGAAGIPGVFLPWRDVLHEGPVPQGLSLEALSRVRAQFIIECGWGDPESIKQSFIQRDRRLSSYRDYDKVILWFEHDLYDQLQILQILDWFSGLSSVPTNLSMICTEHYLGMLTAAEMRRMLTHAAPVTERHLALAHKAWAAFRSTMPGSWAGLLAEDTSVLPFLNGAISRLLEEYPSCLNGLSRTAQQALNILLQGETRPDRVFGLYQQTEQRRFRGDSSFWVMLSELLNSNPPVLRLPEDVRWALPTTPDQVLRVTSDGKALFEGRKDWLDMVELNRWIGGVHLTPKNIWRWDEDTAALVKSGVRSTG